MPRLHRLVSGLRAFVWRSRGERELDEELRGYLATAIERKVSSGLSLDEATRAARVEMGSLEAVKDKVRDIGWETRVESLIRDLRFAVRSFLRAPRFTIPALVTLALGIGGTSAMFSVVRSVMLEPLPYRDLDRIVAVWETNRGGTSRNVIAPSNFVAWRERTRTLEHLGMVGPATIAMIVDGQPDRVSGLVVSADVFRALGVQPVLGRAYAAEEDADDAVIVLSHDFWQRRLGGRRDVLDLTLSTHGGPRTVIGVMPAGFTVVGQNADFLIPPGQTPEQLRAVRGRGSSYAIARLRDSVSIEQARDEMRRIFSDLEKEAPELNARRTVMLIPLQEQLIADLRPAIFALVGAVALVLLVACVNVANLLLARCAARERELGMRTALGAMRGRLVRQMLTESLVLSTAGGVAGLAVAALCHRGLLALVGERIVIPRLDQIALDVPAIGFTMATAIATGILFGLAPAIVSTSHAGDAIRDGGRHGGGRRLRRMLDALVVAEVALSLVLLTGAGLLMRSFVRLQRVDPGFRAEGVLAANAQLPPAQYDFPKADAFFRESLSRIAALPGVEHAAGASCLPVPFPCIGTSFWRTDRPKPSSGERPSGHVRPVTPGYFRTLAIPQFSGRDFSESDTVDSLPVAIVSQELVRRQFPDGEALGRRLRINVDHANGRDDVEWTVVGIVGSTKSSLDGPDPQTIFIPRTQRPSTAITYVARSRQDPMSLASGVTSIVHSMEPGAPVVVRTLEDVVGGTIARPRAIALLIGMFALVALVLAAVGVYGVMAYSVLERTQEIGVRMALGATAAAVFRLVLGQALRLVVIGIAAGVIAAAALTRLLAGLLFEIPPLDPWTFGTTALVLLGIATLAAYVPARRGMHIAPVEALRAP